MKSHKCPKTQFCKDKKTSVLLYLVSILAVSFALISLISLFSLSSGAAEAAMMDDFQMSAASAQVNTKSCEIVNNVVTVTNTGYRAASYAVSIAGSAAQYSGITPASFVLNQGQKIDIFIAFRAPCGSSGTYTLQTYVTTGSMKKSVSQKFIVTKVPNVLFFTNANYVSVSQCEKAAYTFTIRNTGNYDEKYGITFNSDISRYAKISENPVQLSPGMEKQLNFTIWLPCSMKGNFSGNLIAEAQASNLKAGIPVYLSVIPNETAAAKNTSMEAKYGAEILTSSIKAGRISGGTDYITVQNKGTDNATYLIDFKSGQNFILTNLSSITIPAGEKADIPIIISPNSTAGNYTAEFGLRAGEYYIKKDIQVFVSRSLIKESYLKYKTYMAVALLGIIILFILTLVIIRINAARRRNLKKEFMEGPEKSASDEVITAAENPSSAKEWKLVLKERPVTMLAGNSSIAVSKIIIETRDNTKKVQLKIQKPSKMPEAMDELFNDTYQLVSISKKNLNDSQVKSALIKFRIQRDWFFGKSAKPKDMVLARYRNGWKNLDTMYKGTDGEYHYYEAITPGFSYFAITARDSAYDQKPKTISTKGKKGAEVEADEREMSAEDAEEMEREIKAKTAAKAEKKARKEAKRRERKDKKQAKPSEESDRAANKRQTIVLLIFLLIALALITVAYMKPEIYTNLFQQGNATTNATIAKNASTTGAAAGTTAVTGAKNTTKTTPATTAATSQNKTEEDPVQKQVDSLVKTIAEKNLTDSFKYQVWSMNRNKVIDLSKNIYDKEGKPLNYSISKIGNITAKIKGTNLILTPDNNWYGIRQATISAVDIEGNNVSVDVTLAVTKKPVSQGLSASLGGVKDFLSVYYPYLLMGVVVAVAIIFISEMNRKGRKKEADSRKTKRKAK